MKNKIIAVFSFFSSIILLFVAVKFGWGAANGENNAYLPAIVAQTGGGQSTPTATPINTPTTTPSPTSTPTQTPIPTPDFSPLNFPGHVFPTGRDPYIVVGDFNKDGHEDIATANLGSDTVSVLLGAGDGTFLPAVSYGVGGDPWWMAAGDVTNDGNTDLVTSNGLGQDLSLLINNGDGTFMIEQRLTFTFTIAPQDLKIADFNNDNVKDIVVSSAGAGDEIIFLESNGDGTFMAPKRYDVADEPIQIIVVDIGQNGILDLIITHRWALELTLMIGKGDGTFENPETIDLFPLFGNISSIAVSDQSAAYIYVTSKLDNKVGILEQQPDNSYILIQTFDVGNGPITIRSGFLNGDSFVDLAVKHQNTPNAPDNGMHIYLGDATGNFTFLQEFFPGSGHNNRNFELADFDEDGSLDAAIVYGNDHFTVNLGNGDGSFFALEPYYAGYQANTMAIADLDDDEDPEIITANFADDNISILTNNGSGIFPSPPVKLNVGNGPDGIAIADINHDDFLDIVVTNYLSRDISLYLGTGGGGFNPEIRFLSGRGPLSPVFADVNLDTNLDLIVANGYIDNDISVYLGDGTGQFPTRNDYPVENAPVSLVAGDFNDDGYPDIAVANRDSDSVSILINNQDGTFPNNPVNLDVSDGPSFITAAYLDNDPYLDLITANEISNDVSILYGLGNGNFEPPVFIGTFYPPTSVAVYDINNDGFQDLMVTNSLQTYISILLGDGARNFSAPQRISTGSSGGKMVIVADLNLDGKPDIVVTPLELISVQKSDLVILFQR